MSALGAVRHKEIVMSAATVAGLLTAIPWKTIIEHGPGLIDKARGLFKKSQDRDAKETPEQRLDRLEAIVKDQAQLVEQLVERQELLMRTIQVMDGRIKFLSACALATACGLLACIALLLR